MTCILFSTITIETPKIKITVDFANSTGDKTLKSIGQNLRLQNLTKCFSQAISY